MIAIALVVDTGYHLLTHLLTLTQLSRVILEEENFQIGTLPLVSLPESITASEYPWTVNNTELGSNVAFNSKNVTKENLTNYEKFEQERSRRKNSFSRSRKRKVTRFSWRHPVTSGHILVILLSDLIKATFIFWPIHCD